jgi:hypothetical protein
MHIFVRNEDMFSRGRFAVLGSDKPLNVSAVDQMVGNGKYGPRHE